MKVLVTGAAGFIGYHLARRFLDMGVSVVGLDCVNDYYDVTLKQARLKLLEAQDWFSFYRDDLADTQAINELFDREGIPGRCSL